MFTLVFYKCFVAVSYEVSRLIRFIDKNSSRVNKTNKKLKEKNKEIENGNVIITTLRFLSVTKTF